ncbi:hypothetical protein ABID81_001855 [Frigoribacterium sp. PvP054]|uniref:hypothetical protein n=1 Tax=Frigoribacterium sp. PvP054 TaxID=3156438 RepID=UPI0033998A1A
MKAKSFVTVVIAGLALIQTGCASSEARQVTAIDSRFDQLDLSSLGEASCDYRFQPGPLDQTGNEFSRHIALTDENLISGATSVLEEQGFTVANQNQGQFGEVIRFDGPDGMTAGVTTIRAEFEGKKMPYDGLEDCDVPAEGLTVVSLSLPK